MNYYAKLNPNILLTNVCNQSCSYCFAKNEMKSAAKKEMDFSDLKRVMKFLKDSGQSEIRLMGGEPTLHSQFREVVDLILSQDLKIRLFTNGLFPEELAEWLAVKGNQIHYVFNFTTPAFQMGAGKKIIRKNLRVLKNQEVYASITIDSLKFSSQPFIGLIKEYNISRVRLGIANFLIGNSHWLKFDQYKDFGSVIFLLINKLKEAGVIHISLNCGFVPCMFSSEQICELKTEGVKINGWGCKGKFGAFDVSTDLSIFPCFVAEDIKAKNLFDFNDLRKAAGFFQKLLRYYPINSGFLLTGKCGDCPYLKNSKCSGPCLGYINNSNNALKNIQNNFYFKSIYRLLYFFRNGL